MTNIPPSNPFPAPTPGQANNTIQIAIGAIVTLATIMGTRLTTGGAVAEVRNQTTEIQTELLRISGENKALNIEIRAMGAENKRLNEAAIEAAKAAESRQNQILEMLRKGK